MSDGQWRTVWARFDSHQPDGHIRAAALAVLPGDPPVLLVSEEWSSELLWLKCDNTNGYRLAEGREMYLSIMYKYPFETPRVSVADLDGVPVVAVNSSRGVIWRTRSPSGGIVVDGRIGDWHASDLAIGRLGNRTGLLVRPGEPGRSSQALGYLLPDGEQFQPFSMQPERMGRLRGQLAGVRFSDELYGSLDVQHATYEGGTDVAGELTTLWALPGDCPRTCRRFCRGQVLDVSDEAGFPGVLISRHLGWTYAMDISSEEPAGPGLEPPPGPLRAARLARLHEHPVALLCADSGLSLHDLVTGELTRSYTPGLPVLDACSAGSGQIAVVTSAGPALLETEP